MTIHVQLWSAVPSSWLSFQCCYVKGWSWLVGSCHMTCCALAAFWKLRCFYLDAARTRLEKNERVASIMSAHTARLHLKQRIWAPKDAICERPPIPRQPLVFTCCLRRLSVCARRHAETLCHSAWVPRWDVLGLNGLKLLYCLNWQDLKHVRIKNFLEEAAWPDR